MLRKSAFICTKRENENVKMNPEKSYTPDGAWMVECEDGEFNYLEYRYALSRFEAPSSSWAKLYHWKGGGINWAIATLVATRVQDSILLEV